MSESAKESQKKRAANAAMELILPHLSTNTVLGIGTGSTANYFIDELKNWKHLFDAAVASSDRSSELLTNCGIEVINLNAAPLIDFYVDGADEINPDRVLIKGGGGALTREKIVAAASEQFICIADDSKQVEELGGFPLPVEVLPMSRSLVARNLVELGGRPIWREAVETDNGNWILDVHDLLIEDPRELESTINDIPGVVANGIFAQQKADVVILGTNDGVRRF